MKHQTSDDAWWLRLSRPVRMLPTDVSVAIALALLADLVVLVLDAPSLVRFVVGSFFLFFLPGYAVVAALFPGRIPPDTNRFDRDAGRVDRLLARHGTIGIGERVALSVGTSLTALVLVGLAIAGSPWGLALEPLLVALTGLVVVGGLVATVRRRKLPAERRFRVPVRAWVGRVRAALQTDSRLELAGTLLLAVGIVAAMSTLTYALAVPTDGERFTDFYLVSEDEETGELTAADYPTEFTRGESEPLTVAIENHEQRPVRYVVVVVLQRVDPGDEDLAILEAHELDRFDTRLSDGETWHRTHAVTPTIAGEDLRLTYLLYEGEPPARPTSENAEESLHLWVNVTHPEA